LLVDRHQHVARDLSLSLSRLALFLSLLDSLRYELPSRRKLSSSELPRLVGLRQGYARRGTQDGRLYARGGTEETGFRSCGRIRSHSGSVKTFPLWKEQKHQDYSIRRLPGPAVRRLSEGDQTPETPFELFRDWQRTQTQSSVRTLRSLRQQMDVRFLREQEPPAERQLLDGKF